MEKPKKFASYGTAERRQILHLLNTFINEERRNLVAGFHPDLFSKKYDLSTSESIKYLMIGYEIGMFSMFYSVRCPSCDTHIDFISSNDVQESMIFECKGECLDETGFPVEQKIKPKDLIPFFELKKGVSVCNDCQQRENCKKQ